MGARKRILVIGGGFAGIECVKGLEKAVKAGLEADVSLISEDNVFLFTPMLPQVVSGMLETRHVVMPIRSICKRTKFYEGVIENIDPYGKRVTVAGTQEKPEFSVEYDYLVMALGGKTNFFGMKDIEERAYAMKTLGDATALRNRIIDMMEQAENEENPIRRKDMLSFVIVGGGFAGVETAGEIADLLHDAHKYYPNTEPEHIRVTLIESSDMVLVGFNKKLAEFAYKKMRGHGIDVRVNTGVVSYDGSEVHVKERQKGATPMHEEKGHAIRSNTLIWTAGVAPATTIEKSLFKTERGKIHVNDFLEVPDFPEVFAIGDCAWCDNPASGRAYAPTAQVAEAQAKSVAANLEAFVRRKGLKKFVYKPRGQMAVIGKRDGIASVFGTHISGFWAWFLWRNIYLTKIPTPEKRFRVLLDWTVDLFFRRDISRIKLNREATRIPRPGGSGGAWQPEQ